MSDRPQDPGMPGGEPPMTPPPFPPPPPPPPAAPPAPPTLDLESSTAVRSGGIGGRAIAGALGVVLLIGGVAFAATQVGSDGGASDPEAAVAEMFEAMADEDVLGLLGTLDPGERDTIAGPVEQLFEELKRLDVVDDSFRLDDVGGIDLEFEDLEFRTEDLRDDLVRVHLTGGTASYDVNTDEIPVGEFLIDTFDRFGVEYRGIQESDSDTLDPEEADDTFLVVRDTGDGWHISLGYTAVEAARLEMGAPVPAAGSGLRPIGAESPEAAVEGFLQAAVDIDIEGVVARLSPGELRAVHDYWPVLVADAELPTAADVPADIELVDLELRSSRDGNRAQVFVDSIGIDVVAEDFEGGGTIADGCVEVRGDVRTTFEEEGFDLPDGAICQDDIEELIEEATGGLDQMGFGFGGVGGLALGDGEAPALGITVVQIGGADGGWFVAPLGTWTDVGLAVLETLDRQDLEDMVDAAEEFFGGFTGMVGGGFVPGMDDDEYEYEYDTEYDTGVEEFDDFDQGGVDPATDALLVEMLDEYGGDPSLTDCALTELYATARVDQLYELADAYDYDYEPSTDAQDVFFEALTACGW